MTLEAHKDGRTLTEIREMLESIRDDATRQMLRSGGREADLLSNVAKRATVARGLILDLSVSMTEYVTHCLERETEERGPSL